jgi:hypothetical protein
MKYKVNANSSVVPMLWIKNSNVRANLSHQTLIPNRRPGDSRPFVVEPAAFFFAPRIPPNRRSSHITSQFSAECASTKGMCSRQVANALVALIADRLANKPPRKAVCSSKKPPIMAVRGLDELARYCNTVETWLRCASSVYEYSCTGKIVLLFYQSRILNHEFTVNLVTVN